MNMLVTGLLFSVAQSTGNGRACFILALIKSGYDYLIAISCLSPNGGPVITVPVQKSTTQLFERNRETKDFPVKTIVR